MLKKALLFVMCLYPFALVQTQTTHNATGGTTTQNFDGDQDWEIDDADACSGRDDNESNLSGIAGLGVTSNTLLITDFSFSSFPTSDEVNDAVIRIDVERFAVGALFLGYTVRVIRIDGGETTLFDETESSTLTVLGNNVIILDNDTGSGFDLTGLTGADLNGSTWRIEVVADIPVGVAYEIGVDEVELEFTTASAPMPVDWKPLQAHCEKDHVSLSWGTYTESNNAYFEVERSTNSQKWQKIGQVKGSGTTFIEQAYDFHDFQPIEPLSYYRIKQVDYDGAYDYSEIRSVFIEDGVGQQPDVKGQGKGQLWIDTGNYSSLQVQLISPLGQLTWQKEVQIGQRMLTLPDLPPGVYFVQLIDKRSGQRWTEALHL